MSARLTTPNDDPSVTHVLDPDVSDATFEDLWANAASCLVQISRLTFSRIGAVAEAEANGGSKGEGKGKDEADRGGSYAVAGRPITHNMTDMVRLANIPRAVLPQEGQTYGTADEWYVALAEMHLAQLVFQHNDLVESADDCRNKDRGASGLPATGQAGPAVFLWVCRGRLVCSVVRPLQLFGSLFGPGRVWRFSAMGRRPARGEHAA